MCSYMLYSYLYICYISLFAIMCRLISKEPAAGGPVTTWVWKPCGVNSALPWLSQGLGCCPRFSVGALRVNGTGMHGNGRKAETPKATKRFS